MQKDINVPTAPNNIMDMKFLKNCFFFTWNLVKMQKGKASIINPVSQEL